MQYITYKRFKDMSLSGEVNIPAFSLCEEKDDIIYYEDRPICYVKSENAHRFFTNNDDGQGVERGKLIKRIINKLAKKDSEYQNRWDKIWLDEKCQKYKKEEYADYWLWNHNFYIADIESLEYILSLIK